MGSKKSRCLMTILAIAVISISITVGEGYDLEVGFYKGKCKDNDVEDIVYEVVKEHYKNDITIVAALLRMQFHDCFVMGCDASILLNGPNTEKTATPNGSVRGYELIDDAKKRLEEECPGVVSCADIIVIATRAAVELQSGYKYKVETGRKDGLLSLDLVALASLPAPNVSVPVALAEFAARKLNAQDFVLLLGGHTVGVTHCSFVKDRIYNYQLSGEADKTMDPRFVDSLREICPRGKSSDSRELFLDQTPGSEYVVDNGFYKTIKQNKGLLEIDQRIATHPLTAKYVDQFLWEEFLPNFGAAMFKLGRVPRDPTGEIRRTCSSTNAGFNGGLIP